MWTNYFGLMMHDFVYNFRLQLILDSVFGKDIGGLMFEFAKPGPPEPYEWPEENAFDPFDSLAYIDPCAGTDLPMW